MSDTPFQPLTGDPGLLESKARHYQQIAEAIERSTRTLQSIHDVDDMKSEATEALKSQADDVRKDIDKAQDRYAKTAAALLTYAASLRTAQEDARRAIADIDAKQSAYDTAASRSHSADTTAYDTRFTPAATLEDKTQAADDADLARRHLQTATSELQAAQQRWRDALKAKTDAANTARDAISDVVDRNNHGLEDPSWWEKALDAVYHVFKTICDIAGILAIFLAWVPFLGQVLMVLAAIGAVLALIETAIKFSKGEAGLGDLIFAAVGAVLTVFGGKLIDMAIKGVRGMAVLRSAEVFREAAVAAGKTGRQVSGAILSGERSIQGWGRLAYMSQSAAGSAEGALREALGSPKGMADAIGDAFTASYKNAYVTSLVEKGLSAGMRENGTRFMLELKNFGQRDLLQTWKTIGVAGLTHDAPLVASAAGVTALKAGQLGVQGYNTVVGNASKPLPWQIAGDVNGIAKNFLPGPVGTVGDRVLKAHDIFDSMVGK
jgi:hypothetical protein